MWDVRQAALEREISLTLPESNRLPVAGALELIREV
jgi:hypothetical protein